MKLLQNTAVGVNCTIVSVGGDARAAQRAMELGLTPGAHFRVVRRAPFGGPMEIQLASGRIGVRPSADLEILVQEVSE